MILEERGVRGAGPAAVPPKHHFLEDSSILGNADCGVFEIFRFRHVTVTMNTYLIAKALHWADEGPGTAEKMLYEPNARYHPN